MSFLEIFLISVSLSMDAFTVSICKGIMPSKEINKIAITTGLYFGFFQALMPFLGYFVGEHFSNMLDEVDHFIVFFLLGFISFSMIKDSAKGENNSFKNNNNAKEMLILSIATSIDALAVGVSFAFLRVNIILSTITIGITCFIISAVGVLLGSKVGNRYEKKAEFIGGIVLFLLGLKILIEHLGLF